MKVGDWLEDGDYALAMSSGFFAFFAHCGMLCALEESRLTPSRLSGSSAGGLVAGLYAAGMRAEQIREELVQLTRKDFWDPKPGLGLLGGQLFEEKLRELLPVRSFDECAHPLHLSVYDLKERRTKVLDEGDLASAIRASCALPVLFHPVKRERCLLSDGGIADRPGMDGLPAGRTFYHHIGSRSPWRRPGSKALKIPRRAQMVSLQIDGLARANPFHLERGVRALQAAHQATLRALEMPHSEVIRISV